MMSEPNKELSRRFTDLFSTGDDELRFLAEMRPAGRFEEFLADITAVNNTKREGLAYLLTAALVINRFPDVEHPTPLPRALERALFAILAAGGKLLGLRIPPKSTTPTETGNRSERAANESPPLASDWADPSG